MGFNHNATTDLAEIKMNKELLQWQSKIFDRLKRVKSVNPSTYANEFALAAMILNDKFDTDTTDFADKLKTNVRLVLLSSDIVSINVYRGFFGRDYTWWIYLKFRPECKHYKMLSISDLDFLQCFMPNADNVDFSDDGIIIGEHQSYCKSRLPPLQLLVSAFNYFYRAKTVLGTAEWLNHLAVQSQGN
jgi:hypothetical protein